MNDAGLSHTLRLEMTPNEQSTSSVIAGDAVDNLTKLTYCPCRLHQASTPLFQPYVDVMKSDVSG